MLEEQVNNHRRRLSRGLEMRAERYAATIGLHASWAVDVTKRISDKEHQQNHRPFSFRLPALYLSRPFPPLLVSLSGSFETPAATAKAFAILFPLSELLTLITVVLHSKSEQIIILLESNLVCVMVGELIDIKRLESI